MSTILLEEMIKLTDYQFRCMTCDSVYKTEDSYVKHIEINKCKERTPENGYHYKCQYCNFSSKDKSNCNSHERKCKVKLIPMIRNLVNSVIENPDLFGIITDFGNEYLIPETQYAIYVFISDIFNTYDSVNYHKQYDFINKNILEFVLLNIRKTSSINDNFAISDDNEYYLYFDNKWHKSSLFVLIRKIKINCYKIIKKIFEQFSNNYHNRLLELEIPFTTSKKDHLGNYRNICNLELYKKYMSEFDNFIKDNREAFRFNP